MAQAASRISNALHSARGGVVEHSTTNPACSSAKSAAKSVCVCPRGIMVIKQSALATTTGRPRREDRNALENFHNYFLDYHYSILSIIYL